MSNQTSVDFDSVERGLVEAIKQWMKVDTEHMEYHHGNAQGIARALSFLRGTTFAHEWEAGLDGYQRSICGDVMSGGEKK